MNRAFEIFQFKVVEFDFSEFKRDFVAIADFLMNDEADIDAEWPLRFYTFLSTINLAKSSNASFSGEVGDSSNAPKARQTD